MSIIRIGAFSDTHCGYSGNASRYNSFSELRTEATLPNGLNIRTDDVNKAFKQSIDIFLEEDVDLVLHAGDGMNNWGYKHPFYFNFYMEQVSRLKGKKYVEIAGNHNFAKKLGVGCELEKLNFLEGVHTAYKGVYEQIILEEFKIVIHALPSSLNNEIFNKELERVEKLDGYFNILLAHCGVTDVSYYAKSESSIVVDLEEVRKLEMDLVILGDYHSFTDFGDNIYYPGATERFSFTEAKETPKVLIFEVNTKTGELKLKKRDLDVRKMFDFPVVDAEGKTLLEIQEEVVSLLESEDIEDAIVRVKVKGLDKELRHRHLFLTEELIDLKDKTLIFRLVFEDTNKRGASLLDIDEVNTINILEGFEDFVKTFDLGDAEVDKKELLKLGKEYLQEALDNEIN